MSFTVKEVYGVNKKGKEYVKVLEGNTKQHAMRCVEFNEDVREIVFKEEHNLESRVLISYRKRQALIAGEWVDVNFPTGVNTMIHRVTDNVYVADADGSIVSKETALDQNGDLVTGYSTEFDYFLDLLGESHHNIHEAVIKKQNGIG